MFNNIIQVFKERPWLIGAAAIFGFLFLRPKPVPASSNGIDYNVMLQSQKIAADTNVALSGVSAQVAAVQSAKDAQIAGIQKDIILGSQQAWILNQGEQTKLKLGQMQWLQNMSEFSGNMLSGLKLAEMGHEEAKIGLSNQLKLGDLQLVSDRDVALSGIKAGTDQTQIQSNTAAYLAGLDLEGLKFSLPIEAGMHLQEQETIRNLAWRQKQIAKSGGIFNLLGKVTGMVGDVASTAITRGL